MSNLFRNDKERDLWLKLKAEFIIEFHKKVNKMDVEMGAIDKHDTALYIANNQLEFDEEHDCLRISLEQLLTFSYEQYDALQLQRHKDYCEKHFTLRY